MKNVLLLLFNISVLSSCKQPEIVSRLNDQQNIFTLKLANEDKFQLDSVSYVKSDIQYFQNNESEYLFINAGHAFKQIDIYDFKTHRSFKKVFLEKEGPNGIGATPSGIFINGLDSLFLFFNLGQRLCLINIEGRLIDKFGALRNSEQNQKVPYIEVSSQQPVFRKGRNLLFCTYEIENKNETAGAVFNFDSRTTNFPFSLPNIYSDGWWAGVVYDRYYHYYNKEKNWLIQSFGNDHNIYVISAKGHRTAYDAKSQYLPNKIKAYSKNKGDFMKEEQYLYRHAALQGGYSTIKYDAWQKVYYRFVIRPVPISEYHSPSQTWDNMSIIIMDEDFKNVGEFEIPKDYSWHQSFVSKRGLSFFNKRAYKESEDMMVFGNFKLIKIEK